MRTEPPHRLELTLHKPLFSWRAKPTVVIDGRGQPAQWGVGTWQLPEPESRGEGRVGASGVMRVFVFNRLWRFGTAVYVFDENPPAALVYTPPLLPFVRGRLREAPKRP